MRAAPLSTSATPEKPSPLDTLITLQHATMANLQPVFSLTTAVCKYRIIIMKKTADLLNSQYGIYSVKGKWLYGCHFLPQAFI